MVRREVIQSLDLQEDRFGFEPEITARLAALRYRIYEVGISYSGRTYEEGKKIGWRDSRGSDSTPQDQRAGPGRPDTRSAKDLFQVHDRLFEQRSNAPPIGRRALVLKTTTGGWRLTHARWPALRPRVAHGMPLPHGRFPPWTHKLSSGSVVETCIQSCVRSGRHQEEL